MKKSYHSSEVPTRLATMTRRTDETCWVVARRGGIGAPRDRFRSMRNQHRPDRVPTQQEATHGIHAEVAVHPAPGLRDPGAHGTVPRIRADESVRCPAGS